MSQPPLQISLLAIPEADTSALSGLFTVLNMSRELVPGSLACEARILGSGSVMDTSGPGGPLLVTVTGISIPIQGTLEAMPAADVVIVPPLFLDHGEWQPGRHPEVVAWLADHYARGAILCSACTGALLLAETGLLDGQEATQHWAFEATFRRHFPRVRLNTAKILVTAGPDERLVMAGASASWHDLVLYLIARHAGAGVAQTIAKLFLLQWHHEGQAPYIIFQEPRDHGDGVVLAAQDWLRQHSGDQNPVEQAIRRSGLAERSFSRRFRKATGHAPLDYVQHLRIEAAKQHLEGGPAPVDEISWQVGYQDPAFFRRVFKRITGLTPSAYRRKFSGIGIKQD